MDQFPSRHAKVFQTETGTPYLQEPGVVMLAKPEVQLDALHDFLTGFSEPLNFVDYLNDPVKLSPAETLCKTAAQLCYMSFGPKRTHNQEAAKYFNNIKLSGHGSVLEHANFSFLLYGVSRSLTHELVRHRAGVAFSQVSQRYVSGKVLRFVERPEYQNNPSLHERFLKRINAAAAEYESLAQALQAMQSAGDVNVSLVEDSKTDLRKKVQQVSRSCLPNETEAPIVVTGNMRAWRHIIEMRANPHAEVEIRRAIFKVFECLQEAAPIIFNDYKVEELGDGTKVVEVDYRKV